MADAVPGRGALYWAVARRSFRRYSTYRGATFAGAFTNTVFGFIRAYVLLAVFEHRTTVGALDVTDAVTFSFLGQAMLAALAAFSSLELAQRIETGDVVADLYRPFDLQAWWLAQDLGRAAFHVVFRGFTPFLAGALVFDLRIPANAGTWAAFAATLAMALLLSFAWRFLVALAAFWLVDSRGLSQMASLVLMFFSGFVLPVDFFPSALRALAAWLPFSAMVQLPAEVFLGQHPSPAGVALVLIRQLAWLGVLVGLGRLALARAWRRVVVQGG